MSTKNFRFSGFVLDGTKRVLLKKGQQVALNSKAFDLLFVLIEHHGQVLSKDELLDKVWPGQFIEEGNLRVHIANLRRIFGSDKNDHDFIVTVPGRGYSFVAEIETPAVHDIVVERRHVSTYVVEENDDVAGAAQLLPPSKWRSRRIIFFIAAASLLIVAISGGWISLRDRGHGSQIESIAVMPFIDESGNADAEYLSDGITEILISKLAQLPNLSVKARASVFRYKGKNAEPRTVGKELSVQAVLLGRVIQRNEQISVFLELVDASSGNRIWGEQYVRQQDDLVSMQAEIARDVSQKLRIKLSGPDEQRFAGKLTEDPEAYRLYLKGLFYANKFTEEGYQRSIVHFQKAIDRDPNFARAYAGIAGAYIMAADWYLPNALAMQKAKLAAARALEIDDSIAEGHFALAMVNMFYEWNWPETEKEFRRSIELNPSYAPAYGWHALFMATIQGRYQEAIVEGTKAVQLDPLSPDVNFTLAQIFAHGRQPDKAVEILRETIEMDKDVWWAHFSLGDSYERLGRLQEAVAEYELARELDNAPVILSSLGRVYARTGKKREALKLIDELKANAGVRYEPSTFVAGIYDGLGDREQALSQLERGVQERTVGSFFLKVDLFSDDIRSDPRFQDLIKQVGLD